MPVYEADIKPISQIDHVRLRPGMYIGGKDKRALHNWAYLALDSAVEEAVNGGCSYIEVTLYPGEQLTIVDDSRGMPTHTDEYGRSHLELAMSAFGQRTYSPSAYNENYNYRVSGGLHGIGMEAINALSSYCHVEVRKSVTLWQQSYKAGAPLAPVEMIRPYPTEDLPGNTITLTPDFTIFELNTFDYNILAKRCREIAYLVPNLTVVLRDERTSLTREIVYCAPNGLIDWVQALNKQYNPLHEIMTLEETVEVKDNRDNIRKIHVAFALQYVQEADSNLLSYVNTVETTHGGTHLTGFLEGLRRTLKRQHQRPTRKPMVLPGLTAILKILHPDPSFESMSHTRLFNPEVEQVVRQTVMHALKQRPDVVAAMAKKMEQA